MGVTTARFTAMNAVTGKSFIHCDPDDYVDLDMYQSMYDEIVRTDADMVYCDFEHFDDNGNKKLKKEKICSSPEEMIRAVISPSCDCYGVLWIKLWKSHLKDDVYCPASISICEDSIMSLQMLLKCKCISYIPKAFYHYYTNYSGLCKNLIDNESDPYVKVLQYIKTILSTDLLCNSFPCIWQHHMYICIRGKFSEGKELFTGIPIEFKKKILYKIYGEYPSYTMFTIRVAFLSYPLALIIFYILSKIQSLRKRSTNILSRLYKRSFRSDED